MPLNKQLDNVEPGTGNRNLELRQRVLVVDDERSMRELLSIVLRREGYDVTLAENGRMALDQLDRARFDLLISDIKMPDMSGVDVLREAKRIDQDILGIMITAFASADTAIEAMRLGAHDYLSKPFDVDELKIKVRNALEQRQLRQENVLLKRALGTTHQFANIVGRSEKMLAVFKLIEQIARTDSTVLVTGESGTGKEWVARAIHFYSLRRDRPFVALNCGALPETLLESELFGHVKGAFTGASANKKGLIEAAENGTLFLDEIGDMTPADAGEAAARAAGAEVPAARRSRRTRGTRSASSPRPTRTCRRWSRRANSVKTCFIALTSSRFTCRRCVSAARTFRCWPITFSRSTAIRWARPSMPWHRSRWAFWPPTSGRETSESSKM